MLITGWFYEYSRLLHEIEYSFLHKKYKKLKKVLNTKEPSKSKPSKGHSC